LRKNVGVYVNKARKIAEEEDAAVRDGIEAAYRAWFSSMESGDVALALSVVTDDIVQQGTSGAARVGKDALAAALRAFHAAYVERVQWAVTQAVLDGDRARVRVREVATVRPRDGGPSVRVSGWHAAELVRDGEGGWRIARDVSTLDGVPELVERAFDE
jgi:uncharacterized protein (TIGR02246 family)